MEKEPQTPVAVLEEKKKTRIRNYNVFLIGLCFAFIFTGFYTMSQTQARSSYKSLGSLPQGYYIE